jgi:hypothetical protein
MNNAKVARKWARYLVEYKSCPKANVIYYPTIDKWIGYNDGMRIFSAGSHKDMIEQCKNYRRFV